MASTDYLTLLREGSLHPLAGVTGLVPSTRAINTTGALTGGGSLTGDLTLGVTTSPSLGATVVATGRTLTGSGAIQIDSANTAKDLSANRTISALSFAGTAPGLVPVGTNDASLFLSQTGWHAGTVVGVETVTGTAPVVVDPDSGDVVVSVTQANISSSGIVPATGGVDPTKSLLATNPISWGIAGAGAYVQLQATTPGTPQTGHSNISGTAISGKQGIRTQAPVGLVNILSDNSLAVLTLSAHNATAIADPDFHFRRSRGTESSPSVCADGDSLGTISVDTRLTSSWLGRIWLKAFADGAGGAAQAFGSDSFAGSVGDFTQVRSSGEGVRIATGLGSVSAVKAKSSLDVVGSLGLSLKFKTANFTPDDDSCLYYIDGSGVSNPLTVTLPTAVGKAGRVYGFIKAETSFKQVQILTTSSQTINGALIWQMNAFGESVVLVSDNANWFVLTKDAVTGMVAPANGSAVASTAAETTLIQFNHAWHLARPGAATTLTASGKFSTTGTPTLRFRVKNANDISVGDSGAITMPSSVTSAAWQLEVVMSARDVSSTGPKVSRAILQIAQAAGLGAAMNSYNMYDVSQPTMIDAGPDYITVEWGTSSASNTVTCLHSQSMHSRLNLVS